VDWIAIVLINLEADFGEEVSACYLLEEIDAAVKSDCD